jgi:riboflavin biosynthesis pyrimidine reductase
VQALENERVRYSSILIEAGPSIINEALSHGLIDTLYLSRSTLMGDAEAPEINLDLATFNYRLKEEIFEPEGSFLTYLR